MPVSKIYKSNSSVQPEHDFLIFAIIFSSIIIIALYLLLIGNLVFGLFFLLSSLLLYLHPHFTTFLTYNLTSKGLMIENLVSKKTQSIAYSDIRLIEYPKYSFDKFRALAYIYYNSKITRIWFSNLESRTDFLKAIQSKLGKDKIKQVEWKFST